jgi:pyrroline-5-carboxylate reductase
LETEKKIAILGAGNIGTAIADGIVRAGILPPSSIILTRRRVHLLETFRERGFVVYKENPPAVKLCRTIILAVEPQQVDTVLHEIGSSLSGDQHILISVVTGLSIRQISDLLPQKIPVVRAMPNTAIANSESMTCLAYHGTDTKPINVAREIFDAVGKTLVIEEEQMTAATALGACGIAFFLRAIRAASQGGIEAGFHSADALLIAAQTAKGAASLLLSRNNHPESEIDRVTTPRGCTIAGLNQMEHEGFSSAMIKGILTSAEIAARLYTRQQDEQ